MRAFFVALVGMSCALSACGEEATPAQDAPVIILENNAGPGDMMTSNAMTSTTAPNADPNMPGKFDDCPVAARPVYVIDGDTDMLSSFDPSSRTFKDVGQLRCPAAQGATPFSMSVDRDATAWVVYSSGEVFFVDTADATCRPTQFRPDNSFTVFGMGFVLESPTSTQDVLYIAGGTLAGLSQGDATLGSVDFAQQSYAPLAKLSGWPELTGTALGELWGFFPGTSPPKVAQIDRLTGAEGLTFPVTSIDGNPNAWAFAFWGGNFYLFYKSQTDDSTRVFELDGETGSVEEIITQTGRYIVGAGVSTCAPTQQM